MNHAADMVWGPFETTLRTLYLEQDLSLAKVMHIMATKHQFNATKSQYEAQFKKWQFRKNCTAEEWKIVAHKVKKRKREHKESEVVWNGNLINPKKLRKETLRHGSFSTAIEILAPGPSPPTPKCFIIRTPSPKLTASVSVSTEFGYIHPPVGVGSVLMDCLPFHQFKSAFGRAGNPLLYVPAKGESDLAVLSQDIHSNVLEELTRGDGEKASGSFSETIKALLSEKLFSSNPVAVDMAISELQPSSALQFLELTIYLVSNNIFRPSTDVQKKVYEWIKRGSNADLMKYILSIGGPTVEALTENLFGLAIDAEDTRTITEMMKLGIDPNKQACRTPEGYCCTALQRACEMQSLKLVRALIDGGAKVDVPIGNNDAGSVLLSAVTIYDEDDEIRAHVDPELVRILLEAGAVVNSGFEESPLVNAAEWGHVEVVDLLVSAGADVNIIVENGRGTSTPLTAAAQCADDVPHTDVISIVRILLNAGADPRPPITDDRGITQTALELAMHMKSIELIQLLLENGALVTEQSFINAVSYCDVNVVMLLLKFGGQITDLVIEGAVEHNSTLVPFLLETADDRNKKRYKTAALIKSIECRDMDIIRRLSASGAQLKKTFKLESAIGKVIREGDIDVLRFLLDEESRYRNPTLESLPDTSLYDAITNSRNGIVELLLTAGANVNGTDKFLESSPLLAAIRKKDLHLTMQLLISGSAVNGSYHRYCNTETTSVLPAAVHWGHYPLIEDIISAGAEIDAQNEDGKTALVVAVEKRDAKSIQLLIDAGASVNTSGSKRTALEAASRNNDLQMVQYLLGLGADPDEWSLVHAVSGSLDLMQTLLAAHLNRNRRYPKSYGCGALQNAIRLKNATMIKVLLAEGVNANAIICYKSRDRYRYPSYITFLEPFPDFGQSALSSAIRWDKSKDSWIVRMLLCGGADPNSIITDRYETALLVAIDENNLALVKVLIAAGADANPNLRYGVQRTPLQLAAEKGRIDIVNVLLDNGANINALPFARYGATALQFAAIGGYIGIAQLLIQQGADFNALPANIGGRTALEGAAEHGRIDMLQLLLNAGALIIGTGLAQYDRARELALDNGHRAACQLLEKYSTDMLESFIPSDDMLMDLNYFEEGLPF